MKKLFSPFGRNIPVALTSGHTFVVTTEPVNVPDMYVPEAMARGAVALSDLLEQSANDADQAQANPSFDAGEHASQAATGAPVAPAAHSAEDLAKQRAQKIKEALVAMMDGSDEADFTGAGVPQLARIKARVGFAVTRSEVDAVWAEVSANL